MAFCPEGMLSTALLDDVVSVDKDKQQVTVQAGARVQQVTPHLYSLKHYIHMQTPTTQPACCTSVGSRKSKAAKASLCNYTTALYGLRTTSQQLLYLLIRTLE